MKMGNNTQEKTDGANAQKNAGCIHKKTRSDNTTL